MNSLPLDFYSEQPTHLPLKTDLFTRIHEMKGITEQLLVVDSLTRERKLAWLEEHEHSLRSLLEKFADRLPVDVEDHQMDQQTMHLLFEYSTQLQEMVSVIQHMLRLQPTVRA